MVRGHVLILGCRFDRMQSGAIYSISVLLAVAVPVSKDYRVCVPSGNRAC